MDASYKIQRGIHVHLIQFFMCPEFWVHIMAICYPALYHVLPLDGFCHQLLHDPVPEYDDKINWSILYKGTY